MAEDEKRSESPSDEDVVDQLPADLDTSGWVGPYLFPNNNRRRIPGYLYALAGAAAIGVWALTRSDDPVYVNGGFLLAGIGLVAFGLYHLLVGWNLDVDERDALVAASRE